MTLEPIRSSQSPQHLCAAAALFAEYAQSIADVAGASLQQQGFAQELLTLPGKYAHPRGRIYLVYSPSTSASCASFPVGCGALRPLDLVDPLASPIIGEIKRMYIKPSSRREGLGAMLLEQIILDAKAIGYARLVLDTSASMTPAITLYSSKGFRPIAPYNLDPDPTTLWFGLDL
jgi:putative acetyltransferase